jgi:hypothetical protein
MPSRPASKRSTKSKKSKVPKLLPSPVEPAEIRKMLTSTFNASPIGTLPRKLLTFNASPLSPTKRRHSRAAKKMQAFFRGHMVRKMTKKIQSAAKKMQSLFRGRSARNRTSRLRTQINETKQKAQQKRQAKLSREMARLGLTSAPSTDGPRTTRALRQPSYRKNYKE